MAHWGDPRYTLIVIYAEAVLWVLVVSYWLYRLIQLLRAQGTAALYSRGILFHLMMGVMWVGFGKSIYERLMVALYA